MNKKRFLELCKKHNITIAELEKTLNMSNGSLRKEGDIKSQRLKAIADYFNVSMEYLMGEDVAPVQHWDFDEFEMDLISSYRESDPATKEMIKNLLAFSKKMKKEQGDKNED